MAYDLDATTDYIRRSAAARGIDPDTAVRVARSEGLARGTWQSNLTKNGRREPSYGPFQLLVGGNGTAYPTGMGNDFIRDTGLDPSDPANVQATVDYALDRASRDGWGAWYGAAKVGVGKRDGIGGNPTGERPTPMIADGGGQEMAYGGAGDDRLTSNYGGLGGLGGMSAAPEPEGLDAVFLSPGMGDFFGGLSDSLLSNPSNTPLAGVGANMRERQALRMKQEEVQLARADWANQRLALESALVGEGLSPEEARALAVNPDAAELALARREKNDTRDYIAKHHPDLVGMPLAEAVKVAQARWTQGLKGGGKSLTPTYFRRADGTVGIGQLGENGVMVETQMPEGVEVLSPYDLNLDRARGAAAGKIGGEAAGGLAQAEGTAARVLQQVEDLKNDPYLPSMVGALDSRLPNWSSDAARVQGKMNQLQSGAFLEARTALKGGGAITDFESKKAEDAYLRANAAQSLKDYKAALDEFAFYTQQGLAKLRQQAGAPAPSAPPAPPAVPATGRDVSTMSDDELRTIANGR